jgi:hypothetical protein
MLLPPQKKNDKKDQKGTFEKLAQIIQTKTNKCETRE